ncbi:unnamed protein product, partial [Pleuronectes platessa]
TQHICPRLTQAPELRHAIRAEIAGPGVGVKVCSAVVSRPNTGGARCSCLQLSLRLVDGYCASVSEPAKMLCVAAVSRIIREIREVQ